MLHVCSDLRYHSADILGVDEFNSRNKQTLTFHLLKVLLILHLQGGGDMSVWDCILHRELNSIPSGQLQLTDRSGLKTKAMFGKDKKIRASEVIFISLKEKEVIISL